MFSLWFVLIVPGVVCLYALIIRGFLRKVPALQKFYAEADGFWAKVWSVCGNSLTIAWSHLVGGIGMLFELMNPIASMLGDSDFKDQLTNVMNGLQMNPQVLGYILIGISVITTFSRLRTLGS